MRKGKDRTSKLYKIILSRRTIRLFRKIKVSRNIVRNIINSARLAPSSANLQFIEYLVVDEPSLNNNVFSCVKFGGYVFPRRVPDKKSMPSFYIIILINKNKSKEPDLRDVGAAAQNILLSLLCFGLGGCWIANINRIKLRKILKIPRRLIIDSVIACGFAAEHPVLEERADTIRYWLDNNNRLHVPKRPLREILHYNNFP